jgi:hypothetical protein
MQRTLYLHIGTEKTGSTALQVVSGLNRFRLLQHGILYPKAPGDRNHTKLAIFAADQSNTLNLRRHARLFSEDAYESFKAQFAEELRSEVAANPCPRVYLSNEHLSSRLKSLEEVRRLASILHPLAQSVKVVVYLRPQPELYLSTYSTEIKAGRTKDLEAPKGDQHPRYNYEKLLSRWAGVFGEENVIVRIYDRDTLVGHDVVKDFFSVMGYEPGEDLEIPSAINVRLDQDALRFLMEFNKYVAPLLADSPNPDRGNVVSALESRSEGPVFAVPASILENIARIFEASNTRVARRFLGRPDGRLFADVDYGNVREPDVLTAERAVEVASHLWLWQQRQIEEAKEEISRLNAQLKALRKPR